MKKILCSILAFVFILCICSCTKEPEIEKPDGSEIPEIYITEGKTDATYVDNEDSSVTLISAVVYFPVISNEEDNEFFKTLNETYQSSAESYLMGVISDFAGTADKLYDEDPESFKMFSFTLNYDVSYNDGRYLSIIRDYRESYLDNIYETRTSDTFDIVNKKVLYIDDIINKSVEEIYEILYVGFTSIGEQAPEAFYPEYTTWIQDSFRNIEFYLRDSSVYFYLQKDDIAYEDFGYPEFAIPYNEDNMYMFLINIGN